MVLIKVADISNEARPMHVAEPWLDRLLQVSDSLPSTCHNLTTAVMRERSSDRRRRATFAGVLQAERRREDGGAAGDAVHGPQQDHQAVVAVLVHRLRAAAAVRGAGGAVAAAAGTTATAWQEGATGGRGEHRPKPIRAANRRVAKHVDGHLLSVNNLLASTYSTQSKGTANDSLWSFIKGHCTVKYIRIVPEAGSSFYF